MNCNQGFTVPAITSWVVYQQNPSREFRKSTKTCRNCQPVHISLRFGLGLLTDNRVLCLIVNPQLPLEANVLYGRFEVPAVAVLKLHCGFHTFTSR